MTLIISNLIQIVHLICNVCVISTAAPWDDINIDLWFSFEISLQWYFFAIFSSYLFLLFCSLSECLGHIIEQVNHNNHHDQEDNSRPKFVPCSQFYFHFSTSIQTFIFYRLILIIFSCLGRDLPWIGSIIRTRHHAATELCTMSTTARWTGDEGAATLSNTRDLFCSGAWGKLCHYLGTWNYFAIVHLYDGGQLSFVAAFVVGTIDVVYLVREGKGTALGTETHSLMRCHAWLYSNPKVVDLNLWFIGQSFCSRL